MPPETKYFVERTPGGDNSRYTMLLKAVQELPYGRWQISITKYRKPRSGNQNRFYFGNFIESEIECFADRWGQRYDKETIHEFNKSKFWAEEKVIEATGEIIKIPVSSTGYNTVEWEERLEIARQWFRDNLDWELPYPETQEKLNFKQ